MQVRVLVSLKNGVLDPQAKAIFHALNAHGFESLKGVKLSKEILLDLQEDNADKAYEIAKNMCEELLANVVIEDYNIEIIQ